MCGIALPRKHILIYARNHFQICSQPHIPTHPTTRVHLLAHRLVDFLLEHDSSHHYVREMGYTATLKSVSDSLHKASSPSRPGDALDEGAGLGAAAAAALACDRCLAKLGVPQALPISPAFARGLLRRALGLHPELNPYPDQTSGTDGTGAVTRRGLVAAEQLLQMAKLTRGQQALLECDGVVSILKWLMWAAPKREAAWQKMEQMCCRIVAALLREPSDSESHRAVKSSGKMPQSSRDSKQRVARKKGVGAPAVKRGGSFRRRDMLDRIMQDDTPEGEAAGDDEREMASPGEGRSDDDGDEVARQALRGAGESAETSAEDDGTDSEHSDQEERRGEDPPEQRDAAETQEVDRGGAQARRRSKTRERVRHRAQSQVRVPKDEVPLQEPDEEPEEQDRRLHEEQEARKIEQVRFGSVYMYVCVSVCVCLTACLPVDKRGR